MIFLKCPPPQRSRVFVVRWVGLSVLLHGLVLACALGVVSITTARVSSPAGSVMAVHLADMGSSASGAQLLQSQPEAVSLDAAQASSEYTPSAPVDAALPAKQPEFKQAVPLKPKASKAKSSAKPASARVDVSSASKAAVQPDVAQFVGAESGGQGIEGNGSVNKGSGAADTAQGAVKGEASQNVQTAAWNAPGGPGFVRQGPLRYPRSAQQRNIQGKVMVEAYLDMQGKLVRARVLQADHEAFGDAALACIQASSFKPAQRDGRAVPCVVRIPMLFVLKWM